MKILFISHYCGLLGSNRSLASLIFHFRKKSVNVEVLLPSKGEYFKYLQSKGVKVHSFMFIYEALYVKRNRKYLSLPLLWIYDLLMFPLLTWKIHRINPDVIYTNSTTDLWSVLIAHLLGKKHVMHVREFMQEDFGGYCVFGRNIKRKIVLRSDKIIFVSEAVASAVVGDIPAYGRVIYNGLPMPIHEYSYGDARENLRIGLVGNIDVSKQQDFAIKMMPDVLNKYPSITLHLIGDKECPYKKLLKELVSDLHLENEIIFEGFIKNTEEIYSKFDVLLMCSRSEAFGRVTIEAMLRYKPVIGFVSGGTSELIDNGSTGFLFRTTDDVMKALDVIVNKPDKVKHMVENAYNQASNRFSEENYVNRIYEFVINDSYK